MPKKPETVILEGTWEEIQKHADKLAHKRVRVEVLRPRGRGKTPDARVKPRDAATARFLKKYFGAWKGDDYEECLKTVYATRTKARF